MSDIWYGMSLQLLLYLYVLQEKPSETREILGLSPTAELLPAGAVYAPARSRYFSVQPDSDDQAIADQRAKEQKRSGFLLNVDGLPEAWDTTSDKIYSPYHLDKNGEPAGDTLLTGHQFDLLFGHMKKRLSEMAAELRSGSIDADPIEKGGGDLFCRYCDFHEACGFINGENGEQSRILTELKADEVLQRLEEEEENGSI